MTAAPITVRDDRFQLLEALLHNRNRRLRERRFLVQGVRPITLAIENGWQCEAVLYAAGATLSDWARGVVRRFPQQTPVSPELLRVLADKPEGTVEIVAVFATAPDDLARLIVDAEFLGLVLDRPSQPGNIGTAIRSTDALRGSGVIISGHAADLYDPRTVRASTGSLFSVPAVRVSSPQPVVSWLSESSPSHNVCIVATDEVGDCEVWEHDFTGPTLVLIGNEASGLARSWREAADVTVSIPMAGSASSLNAAAAATAVLYEALRQRSS